MAQSCGFDDDRQAGRAYYKDVCFGVDAVHPDRSGARGEARTARLLADAKERFLISGLGSERVFHLRDER